MQGCLQATEARNGTYTACGLDVISSLSKLLASTSGRDVGNRRLVPTSCGQQPRVARFRASRATSALPSRIHKLPVIPHTAHLSRPNLGTAAPGSLLSISYPKSIITAYPMSHIPYLMPLHPLISSPRKLNPANAPDYNARKE